MNLVPVRVALYARVSGDRQVEEGTIASQVEALRQRIAADGLSITDEYCFLDDGYLGGTLERPALERLRDHAFNGEIDKLYVLCPDRLARRYAYQVLLVDEFRRAGVEVIFLNRPISETPEDDLLLQVQGVIAEYERAKILERCRRGRLHAARQGRVSVLSAAPYGYRYVRKDQGDGQARFEIVAEQARVVRELFVWVGQQRLSLREAAKRLTRQGVPTPTGQSIWGARTLCRILRNEAYQGTALYGKTRSGPRRNRPRGRRGQPEGGQGFSIYTTPEEAIPIPVPALVSPELFAAVAEQLQENRRRVRCRAEQAKHLLQGLVVCGNCGYAWCAVGAVAKIRRGGTKRYVYYRCTGRMKDRHGGVALCQVPQLRADVLEEAVWRDAAALLREPDRVEEEYRQRLGEVTEAHQQAQNDLEGQIKKESRKVERLIDAYADGLIDKKDFETRVAEARRRLEHWQEQARIQTELQCREEELRLALGRLQDFAQQVHDGLDSADWRARREILRALVKQVEIHQDEVRVIYRMDPGPSHTDQADSGSQHCAGRQRTGGSDRGRR